MSVREKNNVRQRQIAAHCCSVADVRPYNLIRARPTILFPSSWPSNPCPSLFAHRLQPVSQSRDGLFMLALPGKTSMSALQHFGSDRKGPRRPTSRRRQGNATWHYSQGERSTLRSAEIGILPIEDISWRKSGDLVSPLAI